MLKWVHGVRQWGYKKIKERNEAIDKRNYARAALDLIGVDVNKMAEAGVRYSINLSQPIQARPVVRKTRSSGVSI